MKVCLGSCNHGISIVKDDCIKMAVMVQKKKGLGSKKKGLGSKKKEKRARFKKKRARFKKKRAGEVVGGWEAMVPSSQVHLLQLFLGEV